MMVVASLFVGVNYVYFAIKRVQKDVKGIVVLNGVIFVLLVGLGYLFMTMFGVIGALVCVGGCEWGWVRVRGGDGVEGGVDIGWFMMETGKTSSSDVRFGVKGVVLTDITQGRILFKKVIPNVII